MRLRKAIWRGLGRIEVSFQWDFVWRSEFVISEGGRSRLRRNGSHFPVRWSGYPNANSTAAIS